MKVEAVVFTGAGGLEVIAIGETEVRDPGPGEIQVEVAAAGVNRADVLQRRGLYPAPAGTVVDVPGLELAGRVVARGPGATLWNPGAAVMAVAPGGAMARRITLHEREAIPVPVGMSLTDAAAIPEAFLTAADAFARARLKSGETVVVHAGASGVGTAAVQLVRAAGARPIATSRSREKLDRMVTLALGVAVTDMITVDGAAFATEVTTRTAGRGADVILDCVGAAYLEENLRALALKGRLVLIGTLGGSSGPVALSQLLARRLTVIGTVMRSRPLEEKIAAARDAATRLVPMFERGPLRPIVDAVLPMRDVAEAHRRIEANATVGKLVLAW